MVLPVAAGRRVMRYLARSVFEDRNPVCRQQGEPGFGADGGIAQLGKHDPGIAIFEPGALGGPNALGLYRAKIRLVLFRAGKYLSIQGV